MSKMKRQQPAFTAKPEAEFVREEPKRPEEPQPMECPECKARLVVKIAGGDAALELARCQQCGTEFKIENGKLVKHDLVVGLPNSATVGAPHQQTAGIDKKAGNDLAKVMTNDETPRCPYCGSVKIQELPAMMMSFNRWTCNDCHGSFRAPVKGKAA